MHAFVSTSARQASRAITVAPTMLPRSAAHTGRRIDQVVHASTVVLPAAPFGAARGEAAVDERHAGDGLAGARILDVDVPAVGVVGPCRPRAGRRRG